MRPADSWQSHRIPYPRHYQQGPLEPWPESRHVRRISGTRFCPSCSRLTVPRKRFSWRTFLALLIFGVGIGGLLYLIWYRVKPRRLCSLCLSATLRAAPHGFRPHPRGDGRLVPWEWLPDQGRLPGDPHPEHVARATPCHACRAPVVPGHERPIRVTCPGCGASGTLTRPAVRVEGRDALGR